MLIRGRHSPFKCGNGTLDLLMPALEPVCRPDTMKSPAKVLEHLLSQAIANLLDNALKYTPAGAITLRARETGETARIEVADTGPGVPADRRDAVFDRFVRLESSRSTAGNGLGLSLVRAVARLHGGDAWLEDNAPGLKAVITLPRADSRALPSTRNAA